MMTSIRSKRIRAVLSTSVKDQERDIKEERGVM
jgi:hypothetical protein